MSKLHALKKAANYARLGVSPKDRASLFFIGCLNQLDHHRRFTRRLIGAALRWQNGGRKEVEFAVRLGGRPYSVKCRTDDYCDYQSIWECLGGGMYKVPNCPIRYLFDGGGNLGLFTVAALGQNPNIAETIVVEPDPDNLRLLRMNLSGFQGVKLVAAALAAKNGTSRFYRKASNMGHLVPEFSPLGVGGRDVYEVDTRRLSELIPSGWDLNQTWLKLDIEGAEYEVMTDMLGAGLKPIALSGEFHDYLNCGGEELVAALRKGGYQVMLHGTGTQGKVDRQFHASRGDFFLAD